MGAKVDLKVDLGFVLIKGYASFDALFQFDPFMFMTSMTAGVSLKAFDVTLLAMALAFELNGPARWHAAGEIEFCILGMPLSADFSCTWGKKPKELPKTTVVVKDLLKKEFDREENWSVKNEQASDDEVELFSTNRLVVLPNGVISFNQDLVPLVTKEKNKGALLDEVSELNMMDKCNDARPVDYNKIELLEEKSVTISVKDNKIDLDYQMKQNDFAPSLYKLMEISEKLESKSYVKYNSGFECRVGDLVKSGTGESFENEYEVTYLDYSSNHKAAKEQTVQGQQITEKSTAFVQHLRNKTDFERYVR